MRVNKGREERKLGRKKGKKLMCRSRQGKRKEEMKGGDKGRQREGGEIVGVWKAGSDRGESR